MSENLGVYEPHPCMFINYSPSVTHRMARERQVTPALLRMGYVPGKGINIHYLGFLYPEKGIKFPQGGYEVSIIKKLALANLSLFSSKGMVLPALGFALLPWKRKLAMAETFLSRFSEAVSYVLNHRLQKKLRSPVVRGIRQLLYLFLKNLGFSAYVCSWISEAVALAIQYDDQYRYRLLDIMSLTTKPALMGSPRKEILRLMNTAIERELFAEREHRDKAISGAVRAKLSTISKLLSYLLLIPRVKKAFTEAVRLTDIDSMKYDEADVYYTLLKAGYNYAGCALALRKYAFLQMHNGQMPPMLEIWSD